MTRAAAYFDPPSSSLSAGSDAAFSPWRLLAMRGPDARDFLHRLTSVDVKNLRPGRGQPGFFLTPQGKVRSYFTLWNAAPGEYYFELEAGPAERWKAALLAAIDQYTFAEKIEVAEVAGRTCRWYFPEASDAALPEPGGIAVAADGALRMNHGSLDYGRTWITVWAAEIPAVGPGERALAPAELERWRILAVRPRIDAEITEATIPLEIGLIDGISEQKGCYPGQEVIERILALGAPARRLVLLRGQGIAPAVGTRLFSVGDHPAEIGSVTSVSAQAGAYCALAIVRKLLAKDGILIGWEGAESPAVIERVAPFTAAPAPTDPTLPS